MPGVIGNRVHDLTSVEGWFLVLDADGNERVKFGRVQVAGNDTYGMTVKTVEGDLVLAADESGMVLPTTPLSIRSTTAYTAVTTGPDLSAAPYRMGVPVITADAISVSVPWAVDAATTGELFLWSYMGTPSALVPVRGTKGVALPAATSGFQVFNWKHGLPVGGGPYYFDVRARRLTGAGAVNIYVPDFAALVGSVAIGATVTGL